MSYVYLMPEKAAEHLCIARRTLENWRRERRGPPFRKHGRKVVYVKEELDKWSESQAVNTVDDEMLGLGRS